MTNPQTSPIDQLDIFNAPTPDVMTPVSELPQIEEETILSEISTELTEPQNEVPATDPIVAPLPESEEDYDIFLSKAQTVEQKVETAKPEVKIKTRKLSRSRIESFMKCPRCFYLDVVQGIRQPSMPPFSLNNAVDTLLKKEFDIHRAGKTPHPMMAHYGLDAVPYEHPEVEMWRNNKIGIQYLHEPSGILFYGAIDDVWVNPQGELIIVDYKATAKVGEVSLDAPWQISYKRQMEMYQYLFRHNGFTVSDTGFFVYVNGKLDREAFDGKLEFSVKMIPYTGSCDWIEPILMQVRQCIDSPDIPKSNPECEYCLYRGRAQDVEAK